MIAANGAPRMSKTTHFWTARTGRIEPGTQTAYAMALGMGLLEPGADRDATAAQYVAKLAMTAT